MNAINEIYLVCRVKDLGYDVLYAFTNKESADKEVKLLNEVYEESQVDALMFNCKYSKDAAVRWVEQHGDEYFVETVEIR